jgi:type III pantothenate kinase
MMEGVVLLVDVGNSFLKVAPAREGRIGAVRRLRVTSSEKEVAAMLAGLMVEGGAVPGSHATLVGVSVVPGWSDGLARVAASLGLAFLAADAGTIPLPSALSGPDRTGADRLLAAWAARELHGAPVVVVDVGTATTVDGVDGAGTFRGGAILPGPGLAARSLAAGTAALPEIMPALPSRALGLDTRSAVESGVVIGQLGAIRELASRIRFELDAPAAPVVVGGGITEAPWAPEAFLEPSGPGLPAIANALEPDLLLRGLALLASQPVALR